MKAGGFERSKSRKIYTQKVPQGRVARTFFFGANDVLSTTAMVIVVGITIATFVGAGTPTLRRARSKGLEERCVGAGCRRAQFTVHVG